MNWNIVADTDPSSYPQILLIILKILLILSYIVVTTPVYTFGRGVYHNTILPIIYHKNDPILYGNDFVTVTKSQITSPRFYFAESMSLISDIFGMYHSFLLIYVISISTVLLSVYLITNKIFNDKLISTIVVGMVLFSKAHPEFLVYPKIGGGSLIYKQLTPELIGTALVLVGILFIMDNSPRIGFAFLAVGTIFHVVTGLWMAIVSMIVVVLINFKNSEYYTLKTLVPWKSGVIYSIMSSIAIVPLAYNSIMTDVGFKSVYIDAWIRHPFRFLPTEFPLPEMLLTAILVILFMSLTIYNHYIFKNEKMRLFSFYFVAIYTGLVIIFGYIFVELFPVGPIIQLNIAKPSSFINIFLFGGIGKLTTELIKKQLDRVSLDNNNILISFIIIMLIFSTISFASISGSHKAEKVETANYNEDIEENYKWIKSNTNKSATFLIPPHNNDFRLATKRSIIVNFHSLPFDPEGNVEWKTRMDDVCGFEISKVHWTQIQDNCNKGYSELNSSEIRSISNKYDSRWILTTNGSYNFSLKHSSGQYHVYKIRSHSSR